MRLFNEIEPFAAAWLRTMYGDSHVDTRSIADLQPADIAGFRRVHFFAGIGGWEEALRIAGWPKEREIWTGSAPCQPFSVAGKRGGTADERHLWPEMFRLIRECHPATAMGEQVSSKDGLLWLDGVFADLEAEGYTCWAVDTCAAGVSAPHIRQRLYWVAYADGKHERTARPSDGQAASGGEADRLAYTRSPSPRNSGGPHRKKETERSEEAAKPAGCREPITAGPWNNPTIIHCRDGKSRHISPESGDEPLAHGISRDVGPLVAELGKLGFDSKTARRIIANARRNRTGRLRGFGNAIVPQVAVEFIKSVMEG